MYEKLYLNGGKMNIKNIMKLIEYKMASFEKRTKILRGSGASIGNNCEIYSDVVFGSEPYLISIGDNVRLTSGCKFITHDGGAWVLRNLKLIDKGELFGKISIGNNVHIGINTIIMPNVKIGNNCIIGCGSIVTKDIPDNSVAVGIPAKVIETIDEYYNKNKERFDLTKNMATNEKKKYIINKYCK